MNRAHLIANSRSGKGLGHTLPDLARRVAGEHGFELVHYDTSAPDAFEREIKRAVDAAKGDGGIVLAAGGDGTIRSVAQQAAGTGVTFGAIPVGTFNFFARNHRIPEEPEAALRLAFTGETRPVRLGRINGHYFLINASLGLYAKSIRDRERATDRFGRARLIVILSTMRSLLSRHRNLDVDLVAGDETVRRKTMSIFIGNNALQLRDLTLGVARCMQHDLLAAVVLKPVSRWDMIRIFFRGLVKTLEQEERLESFCVDSLAIKLPMRRTTVALDGEMFKMTSPLRIDAEPEILRLRLPPRPAS
jgi:diacylglycerol kinase family enzyme